MRIVWGTFALLVGATSAFAADKGGHYMVRGAGASSCGTWTQDRQQNFLAYQDSAWVAGFVTAVNSYSFQGRDIAAGVDANGLDAWIDNYCASHPLATIADAAEALVSELRLHPKPPT
jgi:hypothetical protein